MFVSMRQLVSLALIMLGLASSAQVHTSYLWHLQQPIYWPEVSQSNPYRYQAVWESNIMKFNGQNTYSDGLAHPLNNLQDIFGNADRQAVYQYRAKDAVQSLLGFPEAGAQVNYSGCLIENVNSLGNANQWGYGSGWANNFITARNWLTSGGKPRMDITGFTFHHALSPLIGKEVLRKEIQAHRLIYGNTFTGGVNYSKGYWPAECSFSERIIGVLVEEGFEWSVIANSHLARTLADYPVVYGTNGTNYDPPNKADQVSTTGNNWWSGQIDGRGGQFAAPYSYQAHKAQYVDPSNGAISKITVVPMADLLSYQNGFSTMGTSDIDAHIAPYEDPNHPSIVLFAHDGDNAWGGGYDYYTNSVPGLAGAAASQGYVPTTIEQFLADHPVPQNDVVHVEDGSWFNAANDWGHPQFINWLWPLQTNGIFNPNGWSEDARNWAVLIAAENHVLMAEDIQGTADIQDIVYPNSSSSIAERAWHHLLPGYTSGYMYYGTAIDMEVKPSLAANIATDLTDPLIASYTGPDVTPPSVFIPQRFPYNPGGKGYGPVYGYQLTDCSTDFHVWTFGHDVNGLADVVLKYRVDYDGVNPISSIQNETYAGGNQVGPWQSVDMSQRIFPAGNVTNNNDIDFFIMPNHIADEYYAEIAGFNDTLIDYYVEATDLFGNVTRTDIQHVWVGDAVVGPPVDQGISWSPAQPDENDVITITVFDAPSTRRLHWGVNGWNQVNSIYWPTSSFLFQGSGPAIQSPMTGIDADGNLTIQVGPFNDENQEVDQLNFVINYDNGNWDNNNGQDYLIPIADYQNPLDAFLELIGDINVVSIYGDTDQHYWIEVSGPFRPRRIAEVYDLTGRLILTERMDRPRKRISLQGEAQGLYIIKVMEEDGAVLGAEKVRL